MQPHKRIRSTANSPEALGADDIEACAREGEAFIVVCGSCEAGNKIRATELEEAMEQGSTDRLQPTCHKVRLPTIVGRALVFTVAAPFSLVLGYILAYEYILDHPRFGLFMLVAFAVVIYGGFTWILAKWLPPFATKEHPVYLLRCQECGEQLAVASVRWHAHRLKDPLRVAERGAAGTPALEEPAREPRVRPAARTSISVDRMFASWGVRRGPQMVFAKIISAIVAFYVLMLLATLILKLRGAA
jgi:hypothetical protein